MSAEMQSERVIRVGTRGSALAVTQTRWVIDRLAELHPDYQFEMVTISTKGDRILDVTLNKIGDKGLFVKEIEHALLEKDVDLAIHSAKDLPGELPPGLILGAYPKREDPRDVLVCREANGLNDLPNNARIGTSSLRRTAQLMHFNPTFEIVPVRGNIDTRLRRLTEQKLDAIVLAAAGLHRMGWEDRITDYLDPIEVCVPAAGQGVLAVQCREDDEFTKNLISGIDHRNTRYQIEAERAFLRTLEGGCQVPMGGHARIVEDELIFTGVVAGLKGEPFLRIERKGSLETAQQLGASAAERLLEMGAAKIVEVARELEVQERG